MPRTRAWSATILSLLAFTAAMPDWIEALFGVDPDSGSGSLEALIALGLAVLAVISGAGAARAWRKLRAAAGPR